MALSPVCYRITEVLLQCWMELWATWSSARCPWWWQGVGTRWSSRSLPTQTILWFYKRFKSHQQDGKTNPTCLFLRIREKKNEYVAFSISQDSTSSP